MIDHESNSSSTIRENQVYIKEVDLPEIGEEELLVKIVSNSVCLSTYKAAIRGGDHKRVPDDVSKEHPVIIGHEFGGYIVKAGEKNGCKKLCD
jgi:threonine dehydrogenase-like Zn-dependent dehydrogenase